MLLRLASALSLLLVLYAPATAAETTCAFHGNGCVLIDEWANCVLAYDEGSSPGVCIRNGTDDPGVIVYNDGVLVGVHLQQYGGHVYYCYGVRSVGSECYPLV